MLNHNMKAPAPHIWHFCKTGEHGNCSGFGSLVERQGNPNRTYIKERVQGPGLVNVYCECPCHARKEVIRIGK